MLLARFLMRIAIMFAIAGSLASEAPVIAIDRVSFGDMDRTLSEQTIWHRDQASLLIDQIRTTRIWRVSFVGYVTPVAAQRLADDLRLSDDQRLAFWRAYGTYAERITVPLVECERAHFEWISDQMRALFPEIVPGRDLSHLSDGLASKFAEIQTRYESYGLRSQPPSSSLSEASRGSWAAGYYSGSSVWELGPEYKHQVDRVFHRGMLMLRDGDLDIEPPARQAWLEAVLEMLTDAQALIWDETARYRLDLNVYALALMDATRDRSIVGASSSSARVDIIGILEDAAQEGAELAVWDSSMADEKDPAYQSFQRIRRDTERSMAEVAREAAGDRTELEHRRKALQTGVLPRPSFSVADTVRDQRFQRLLQVFVYAVANEVQVSIGQDASDAFLDRVRAARYPALYDVDNLDLIASALDEVDRGEDKVDTEVRADIERRIAKYVSVRTELRRSVADVSYRIIHELSRRTLAEWKILAEAELAWLDAEQAARDDVLASIDCQEVQAIVERALRSDLRARTFDREHRRMRLSFEKRYGTNAQP